MAHLISAAAVVLFVARAAFATSAQPVDLKPISHADATLVIVASDGTERSFTPRTIETLPTYSVETTTPWRDVPAKFEGVMLRDLLAEAGIAGADQVLVTAENEFTATIPRVVWESTDLMVVTRVDGAAHSRRARGPIQFVVDADTYATSGLVTESHLVWMAARIEPMD